MKYVSALVLSVFGAVGMYVYPYSNEFASDVNTTLSGINQKNEELPATNLHQHRVAIACTWIGVSLAFVFLAMYSNSSRPTLKGYLLLSEQLKQLEEANEELVKLNAVKDKMLSIISHDARAPLASLKSFLRLLKNNSLNAEEFENVVTNLDRQVGHLNNFLENLLRWTKSHFAQLTFQPTTLQLYPLAKESVDLLLFSAEKKQVDVYVEVPEQLSIYADEEMVKLVLRNLISNAIKFCDANDKVFIQAKEEGNMVRISVKDTGRGISPEMASKLFDISHMSTKGTKDEMGMGLGLTLCKEFIEKAGGKIQAISRAALGEGKGSCFEFTVPRFAQVQLSNREPSNLKVNA